MPHSLWRRLATLLAAAVVGLALISAVSPGSSSAASLPQSLQPLYKQDLTQHHPCPPPNPSDIPSVTGPPGQPTCPENFFHYPAAVGKGTGQAINHPNQALFSIGVPLFTGQDPDTGVSGLGAQSSHSAQQMLKTVTDALNDLTTPSLTDPKSFYPAMFAKFLSLGLLATAPFLLFSLVESLWRGDGQTLRRSTLLYVPSAIFGAIAFCAIAQALIGITDEISKNILLSGASGINKFFNEMTGSVGTFATPQSPIGMFTAFVVSVLVLAAAFFMWLELLIRGAAIYLLVLFVPLVFAASIWPRARGMAGRTLRVGSSLVLSKIVIVSGLALAGSMLGDAPPGQQLQTVTMGIALMVLTIFAPIALYKLIPLAQDRLTAPGGSIPGTIASGVATAAIAGQGTNAIAHTGLRNLQKLRGQDPGDPPPGPAQGGGPSGGGGGGRSGGSGPGGPRFIPPLNDRGGGAGPEGEGSGSRPQTPPPGGLPRGPDRPSRPPQLPPGSPDSRRSSSSDSDFDQRSS